MQLNLPGHCMVATRPYPSEPPFPSITCSPGSSQWLGKSLVSRGLVKEQWNNMKHQITFFLGFHFDLDPYPHITPSITLHIPRTRPQNGMASSFHHNKVAGEPQLTSWTRFGHLKNFIKVALYFSGKKQLSTAHTMLIPSGQKRAAHLTNLVPSSLKSSPQTWQLNLCQPSVNKLYRLVRKKKHWLTTHKQKTSRENFWCTLLQIIAVGDLPLVTAGTSVFSTMLSQSNIGHTR